MAGLMHVHRSIVVVVAALVVWTFLSYELIGLSSGSHACHLLQAIPPGGFPNGVTPPMTRAEMDAQTAACSEPKPGDFLIPAVGYILIVGFALASASGGRRDTSVET